MQKRNARVILASEHPRVRNLLGGVIERENQAVIVGEAQDAGRALALAKNLKPDVAVIDCYLPYNVNLNRAPVLQMGGLDAAQNISDEIPNIRVLLLNNLDTGVLADRSLNSDTAVILSTESVGVNVSFDLEDLFHEAIQPNALVFVNVEVKERVVLQPRVTSITDKVIFFGSAGIATGWLLTLTMFLAPIGVPLALAGGVMVLSGLAGRLATSFGRRLLGKKTS